VDGGKKKGGEGVGGVLVQWGGFVEGGGRIECWGRGEEDCEGGNVRGLVGGKEGRWDGTRGGGEREKVSRGGDEVTREGGNRGKPRGEGREKKVEGGRGGGSVMIGK